MTDIVKLDRNGSIRYIGDSKVRDSITNEFSTSTNYNINDLVMYDGQLYKFTSNHEAGAWDNSEVVQTTIINEIKNIPLGTLADHDTVDYLTEITNKPTLGGIQVRPDYTIGDTDLTDGSSPLETGKLYFYY